MMHRIITLLLVFLCGTTIAMAQSAQAYAKKGNESLIKGDLYSAHFYYENAAGIKLQNLDYAFKFAEISRKIHDHKNAETFYGNVVAGEGTSNKEEALFWLIETKKSLGKYTEAKELLSQFQKLTKVNNGSLKAKASSDASNWGEILQLLKDTVDENVVNVGNAINSVYSESGAVMFGEKTLYYTSYEPNEKISSRGSKDLFKSVIYQNKLKNDTYSRSRPITSNVNDRKSHAGNVAFNEDYSVMFYTNCKAVNLSKLNCEIFKSYQTENGWSKGEKLGENVNERNSTNTQPTFGKGKNEEYGLYFVSDRKEGAGGNDIYFAAMQEDGSFKPAVAVDKINTVMDEASPFFDFSSSTLYFSSNFHPGLGGYDIFKTQLVGNNFSEIQHLGIPFNSPQNDLYFQYNAALNKGFLTSNRIGSKFIDNETCCYDVWSFGDEVIEEDTVAIDTPTVVVEPIDTPPVVVVVKDPEPQVEPEPQMVTQLKLLVPLTLYFHNDRPDPRTTKITTNIAYDNSYNDYYALKQEYITTYSKGLPEGEKAIADANMIQFFDVTVKGGFEKLEQFTALMLTNLQEGRDVTVTLKGYCSPLASTDYNVNLAKRRISSLRNYFNNYQGGVFGQYYGKARGAGKLSVMEVGVGEVLSDPNVSDNVNDTRNSVYSIGAAKERRIQIIAVSSEKVVK